MQFTKEVQRNETTAYIIIVFTIGGIYELWQWLKSHNKWYRIAFGIGIFGILLIGWANGAIWIIGNENNPANRMYIAVFLVWLIGSIISRFKSNWMARTLFTTAIIQMTIPVFALCIWPAKASWGEAWIIGVFIFNAIFAIIFVLSAVLFQRSSRH